MTGADVKRRPTPSKDLNSLAAAVKVNRAVLLFQQHLGGAFSSKASPALGFSVAGGGDGHMTPEEVERHLQSRHSYLELLPERAPPTVPTEMFSNDPSLDRLLSSYCFHSAL